MGNGLYQQGEYDEYAESAPDRRKAMILWGMRAFGLIAALAVWLAMGNSEGLSPDARWVAAIGTLMAIWWMSEAIPLSATSLLPIVLIPMLSGYRDGETLSLRIEHNYSKWYADHDITLDSQPKSAMAFRKVIMLDQIESLSLFDPASASALDLERHAESAE